MAAPEEFSVQVTETPTEVAVVISGTMDERSEVTLPDARGRRVVIDAHGIHHINSMGCRAWMDMMQRLSEQTRDVVLTRLPAILVTQASMVTSFLGNAQVHSFLTPWICMNCEHALEQLHGGTDPVPEAIKCPSCGSAMELDWDREALLAFRR
jgi:anti-anti-sigma regulatory factor/DNA-directed RNA polymerase subunit RPC12/RpoP